MQRTQLRIPETLSRFLKMDTLVFIILVSCFLLWSIPNVSRFSIPGINFYLGLMALPFCLNIQKKNARSFRYGLLSILFALAYWYLQVQAFYFLSFCTLMLFAVEQLWGKVGGLPFFIVLTVSPITHYLVHISSFPLRLKISKICAHFLSFIIKGTYAEGNVIYTHNEPFEVEPACLGLGTLITGALIGYAILGFQEHKLKRTTGNFHFTLWFVLLTCLLIGSNLFRIVALVFFKIPPEDTLHDIVGISSLLVYALLPLWKLSPWFIKGRAFSKTSQISKKKNYFNSLTIFLVSICILLGQQQYNQRPEMIDASSSLIPVSIDGFEKSKPNIDVTKFSNRESIVYYKPCKSFYQGSHSAAGCWQGSGFQLKKEKLTVVNETEIMTAVLEKDSIKLHTAWWYESAKDKSIGELNWRLKMFQTGHQYTIVNVSCISEELLHSLLSDYFLPENTSALSVNEIQ